MPHIISRTPYPKILDDALAAAQQVIPAAILDRVQIRYEKVPYSPESKGSYDYATFTVYVSPLSDHPGMTLLHELGHALDAGLEGYGKDNSSGTASSIRALYAKREARLDLPMTPLDPLLNRLLMAPQFVELYTISRSDPRAHADISTTELFARSFAQYVVERSGQPDLLKELRQKQQDKRLFQKFLQWPSGDFAPIADAYDLLLGL
ncbi:hypothetical protein [Deinococcus sp. ME38]|uniref:hypothetical protein n=1 Tax=Deinococcus sp. ME38 TaxID=3400344 RepID=UPI003B5CF87E